MMKVTAGKRGYFPSLLPLALLPLLQAITSSNAYAHVDASEAMTISVKGDRFILSPAKPEAAQVKFKCSIGGFSRDGKERGNYQLRLKDEGTGKVVYQKTYKFENGLGTGSSFDIPMKLDELKKETKDGRYVAEVKVRVKNDKSSLMTAVGSTQVLVDNGGSFLALKVAPGATWASGASSVTHKALGTNFPYSYFYGCTHGHTRFSDGGNPCDTCQGSIEGEHPGAEPKEAFAYGRKNGRLDFMAIIEHNHLLAKSGVPATEAKDRYDRGFAAAQSATVPDKFVAVYGMEWGVIKNGGHVNVYNQPNIMNWSAPEDVDVPKGDYASLYDAVDKNQPKEGCYLTLNHPSTHDFDNWQRTDAGDRVVRGIAVSSGPAFNNSEQFDQRGKDFTPMYNKALGLGWKVAPEAHQDNHCFNYGTMSEARTVVMIPQDDTFNLKTLMKAYGDRHFYASEDANAQLIFRDSGNKHMMGDDLSTSRNSLNLQVEANDPDGDDVQNIEIWGGSVGDNDKPGTRAKLIASSEKENSSEFPVSKPATGNDDWYYYAIVTQSDGDRIWSAPIWVSWK